MKVPVRRLPQTRISEQQQGFAKAIQPLDVSPITSAIEGFRNQLQDEQLDRQKFDANKRFMKEINELQSDFEERRRNPDISPIDFAASTNTVYQERHQKLLDELRGEGFDHEVVDDLDLRLGTVRQGFYERAVGHQHTELRSRALNSADELIVDVSQYGANNPNEGYVSGKAMLRESFSRMPDLTEAEREAKLDEGLGILRDASTKALVIQNPDLIIRSFDPQGLTAPYRAPSVGGAVSLHNLDADRGAVAATLSAGGLSPQVVAGFLGNFDVEGGYGGALGDGETSSGIAQWRKERRDNFKRKFGKNPHQATKEEQAQFILWELENPHEAGMTAAQVTEIKGAKTAEDAARLIDKFYERSSGEHRSRRVEAATRYSSVETIPSTETVTSASALAPVRGWQDRYALPNWQSHLTKLTSTQETEFQAWVSKTGVSITDDYDMRGFWLSGKTTEINHNDGQVHFPDKFKTPLHQSFSNESVFADPTTKPPKWNDKDQLVADDGTVLFDERRASRGGSVQTGNALLDDLNGPERLQALSWAREQLNKVHASRKAEMDVTIGNITAEALNNGGEIATPLPSQEDVLSVYGPVEGPQRWAQIQQSKDTGKAIQTFRTRSTDDIQHSLDAIKPTPGSPTYETELQIYQSAERAANQLLQERQSDLAAYAMKYFPSVGAAAKKGTTQYYAELDRVYETLGIDSDRAPLLSDDATRQIVGDYKLMSPPQKLQFMRENFAGMGEDRFRRFVSNMEGTTAQDDARIFALLKTYKTSRQGEIATLYQQVLEGREIMAQDPARRPSAEAVNLKFRAEGLSAITNLNADASRAIQEAAAALYVVRGGDPKNLNDTLYREALATALGGNLPVNMRRGEVKDYTILPPKVNRTQFQNWVEHQTMESISAMTVERRAPRYGDLKTPVPMNDIIDEGVFVMVSPGRYMIKMASDGRPIMTSTGRPFLVNINAANIHSSPKPSSVQNFHR